MSDDDEPEAIMRCIRVEQFNRPIPGSETHPCALCGERVWFDPALVDEIAAQYPDHRVVYQCRECVGDDQEHNELHITPGQVRRLREQGADDDAIAVLFALAELAGPTGSLDAVRLEVSAFPNGATAQRFCDALERSRVFVAMTL